jgi:hypothetical protein
MKFVILEATFNHVSNTVEASHTQTSLQKLKKSQKVSVLDPATFNILQATKQHHRALEQSVEVLEKHSE